MTIIVMCRLAISVVYVAQPVVAGFLVIVLLFHDISDITDPL